MKELKKEAKQMFREGKSVREVMAELGISFPRARGLKGAVAKEQIAEKLEEKEKKLQGQELTTPMSGRPTTPFEEVPPPEEFLKNFLEEFGMNKSWIELYAKRVKRREELPHPNELAADIAQMDSGIKNTRNANWIAEEYSYDLKKYLDKVKESRRPNYPMGYDVSRKKPNVRKRGIEMDSDSYEEDYFGNRGIRIPKGNQIPRQRTRRFRDTMDDFEEEDIPQDDKPLTRKDLMIFQMKQELERLKNNGGNMQNQETEWMRQKMERLEDELRQRDQQRIERLEQQLTMAMNRDDSMSKEELLSIIQQTRDNEARELSPEEIRRIIKEETTSLGGDRRYTKDELDYMKAQREFDLEERKLEEKGKTRDKIAGAIQGGFGQVGQIIARTLFQPGEDQGTQVTGRANQQGNMMQMQCPDCGYDITAPIGAQTVMCPSCNKQYNVEMPGNQPQKVPPPLVRDYSEAPQKQEPIPEKPIKKDTIPEVEVETIKDKPIKKEKPKKTGRQRYYRPNIKKENVPEAIDQLKEKHSELSDEDIHIEKNKQGNYSIYYNEAQ